MSAKNRYGDGDECNMLPVTDGTTQTSVVVDMRDKDSIAFQLETTGTLTGTWAVQVSNNFVPVTNGSGSYGQMASDGTSGPAAIWTDITSAFSPAITNPAGAPTDQYVQADLTCRSVRVVWTRSAGAGTTQVLVFAKSWS